MSLIYRLTTQPFLLLAEHLSCPLATLDKDLRKAAKKRGVAIAALDQQ